MSRVFSSNQFSDAIVRDRTWRLREISDLKSILLRTSSSLRPPLMRALVAICYAHWEGHIKFASRQYLVFVAQRRLLLGELHKQFSINYFVPRIVAVAKSGVNFDIASKIIQEIIDSDNIRYGKPQEEIINTRANLNWDVFLEICAICHVDGTKFIDYKTFVNLVLLKRRNAIAHGEDVVVDIDEIDEFVDSTLELIRFFDNELENNVSLYHYRADQDIRHER